MAKQRFGINDGYRGTVGTVIGYQWRGKWCLRARPRFVRNPRTEAQQRNRGLFKQVVQLAGTLKKVLRKGLHDSSMQLHMTECNLFYRLNKQCFSLDGEALAVDYGHLLLAQGEVAPVGFGEPAVGEGGVLTVPFTASHDERRGNGYDEVYLYAWCPALGEGRLSTPTYRHSERVSVTLPEDWAGLEVHLYGFVLDHNGRASDSQYLGCLQSVDETPEHTAVGTENHISLIHSTSQSGLVTVLCPFSHSSAGTKEEATIPWPSLLEKMLILDKAD